MKKRLKIFTRAKIFLSVFLCVLLLGTNFIFADPILVNGTDSSSKWENMSCSSDGSFTATAKSSTNGSTFLMAKVSLQAGDTVNYKILAYPTSYASGINLQGIGTKTIGETASYTASSATELNIKCVIGSTAVPYGTTISGNVTDYVYISGISSEPTPAITGSFDLQVGNITFIDLGNSGTSYDLTLKSYFNKLSGTLSGGWEYDNRRYGFSSSLPDTSFSVDGSSGSGFTWTKTDPKNILGRSHYGLSNISGNSSGRYLWIVNPLYNENYYNDSLSGESINGRINISGLPSGCTFYTYPLVQSATSINLASDVASTSGGTGTVSETGGNTPTVSLEDPNSSYTQPIGGDNSPPEEVTLQEGVNQLFQTLKDFTEKVINLLSAPADFIQQLISAGQGFTQAIASMFTWLPQAVQNVLIAALGVMIVVGFLKLLF